MCCLPIDADGPAEEPPFDPGVAGASARREYERRRANRETRVKDRFGRFGGVVLALTDDPQSTRAWATGARGEEKFAKALEGIEGLRVLNDRRVPRSKANIDHILIASAGVFVVDAKNYRGIISIRDRGWFLRPDHRLYVGRRDCSALATGLGWQISAVTAALTDAGVDPMPPVTPVLCFVDGEWPLFGAPDEYAGVRLEGTGSIRKLVAAPGGPRPTLDRQPDPPARGGPPRQVVIELRLTQPAIDCSPMRRPRSVSLARSTSRPSGGERKRRSDPFDPCGATSAALRSPGRPPASGSRSRSCSSPTAASAPPLTPRLEGPPAQSAEVQHRLDRRCRSHRGRPRRVRVQERPARGGRAAAVPPPRRGPSLRHGPRASRRLAHQAPVDRVGAALHESRVGLAEWPAIRKSDL